MNDLIDALPGLGFVGLAVGVVAVARLVFGDRRDADEHDLSDYHEAVPVNPAPRSLARVEQLDQQDDVIWGNWTSMVDESADILPPAPPGMDAGSPLYRELYAEQVVAERMREQYGTTNHDNIAARFLRELRDEALAVTR